MIDNVGDFISHYGILKSSMMVFVDDNVVWYRQMRVFLLRSQVPIFLALSIIVLEDLKHPMYPFLGRQNILDCSLVNPLLFVFQ
jgi:hypothetical protein